MRSTLSMLLFAVLFSVTACGGPSAEEKAKEEAAKAAMLDSITNAASMPAAVVSDSTSAPAAEEAHH